MKALLINSNTIEPFCAYYTGERLITSFTSEFFSEDVPSNKKPDKLIHCLLKVTAESGKENNCLEDIDVISVNTGPGSFTSIRVGLSIAKGVSDSIGKKIIALTDFDIQQNRLDQIDDSSYYLILIPSKIPEYYYSLREGKKEIEYGFIDTVNLKNKFDKNVFVITDLYHESIEKLDYFHRLDLKNLNTVADSMFKLTIERFNDNELCSPSDVKPLYIKDFVVK